VLEGLEAEGTVVDKVVVAAAVAHVQVAQNHKFLVGTNRAPGGGGEETLQPVARVRRFHAAMVDRSCQKSVKLP